MLNLTQESGGGARGTASAIDGIVNALDSGTIWTSGFIAPTLWPAGVVRFTSGSVAIYSSVFLSISEERTRGSLLNTIAIDWCGLSGSRGLKVRLRGKSSRRGGFAPRRLL